MIKIPYLSILENSRLDENLFFEWSNALMSQEVSKRLGSVGYNPTYIRVIIHLLAIY